jgi:hypothetical protein
MTVFAMNDMHDVSLVSISPGFLEGMGSVLDLGGSRAAPPLLKFGARPVRAPLPDRTLGLDPGDGPLADRAGIMDDWEQVGRDLEEATHEYRPPIGARVVG